MVASALGHSLLRRAAAASTQGYPRRETAIRTRLEDETLSECVAELAFLEADQWTVVVFKTDGELGAHESRYRRQVALYARGIADPTSGKAGIIHELVSATDRFAKRPARRRGSSRVKT